jgi:antitoxin component YwqK of YwqJK toxin-antitoxin module
MDRVKVVDEDEIVPSDDEFADYLYEGQLFTGISREKDPRTGTIIAVAGYSDGKLHGAVRSWYANGQMAREEFRYNGAYHGPQREWYPSGQLKKAGYVDRGVTVWEKTWSEQGELTSNHDVEALPDQLDRLTQARTKLSSFKVIDIDVNTWEFVERPDGWRIDERP